jgi:hypothetical protein
MFYKALSEDTLQPFNQQLVWNGFFDQPSSLSPFMNMIINMYKVSLTKGGKHFHVSFISDGKLEVGEESHGK